MVETLVLAVAAYIGTNIDDIFLDTILFAQAQNKAQRRGLYLGQQIGVGFLALVSVLGAWGLKTVSPKQVGLLGFVPIVMGVKGLIDYFKGTDDDDDEITASGGGLSFMVTMATLTISGGADNIGLYVPMFLGMNMAQTGVTLAVFCAMSVLWCTIARFIAAMPLLKQLMEKYNKILMPIILILLGIYVLIKSGVIG